MPLSRSKLPGGLSQAVQIPFSAVALNDSFVTITQEYGGDISHDDGILPLFYSIDFNVRPESSDESGKPSYQGSFSTGITGVNYAGDNTSENSAGQLVEFVSSYDATPEGDPTATSGNTLGPARIGNFVTGLAPSDVSATIMHLAPGNGVDTTSVSGQLGATGYRITADGYHGHVSYGIGLHKHTTSFATAEGTETLNIYIADARERDVAPVRFATALGTIFEGAISYSSLDHSPTPSERWYNNGYGQNAFLLDFPNGTSNDASIIATLSSNTLSGNSGDNYIVGYSGDDSIWAGDGDDDVRSWLTRTETIAFTGDVSGVPVDDASGRLLEDDVAYGGGGADSVTGGIGSDTLHGDSGESAVSILGEDTSNSVLRIDFRYGDGTVDGNDTIFGEWGDDTLFGGEGEDELFGGGVFYAGYADLSEDDTLFGGRDNDVVHGELGADLIYGGDHDDTLFGGGRVEGSTLSENDTLFGGEGNDLIFGELGDDLIYGGTGSDTVVVANVDAGTENAFRVETVSGGGVRLSHVLEGTAGAGSDGTDTLYDVEYVSFGDSLENPIPIETIASANYIYNGEYFIEEDGDRVLGGSLEGGLVISNIVSLFGGLQDYFVSDLGDGFVNVERLSGISEAISLNEPKSLGVSASLQPSESFITNANYFEFVDSPQLYTTAQILNPIPAPTDDHANSRAGATNISSITATVDGTGSIEVSGDRDFFSFSTSSGHTYAVVAVPDDSTIEPAIWIYTSGGSLVQLLTQYQGDAGAGVSFNASGGTYYVEIYGSGSSTGDYGIGISDITDNSGGTAPNSGDGVPSGPSVPTSVTWDYVGTEGEDRETYPSSYSGDLNLRMEGDDDYAATGRGDDIILGGSGRDILYGGDGRDTLSGDDDDDRVYGGSDADGILGGDGEDRLYGGDGNDLIGGLRHDDSIYGGEGDDRLVGGDGDDRISGGDGDDAIAGGDDEDRLYGGDHDDIIYGGENSDTVDGDEGHDELFGGSGRDVVRGDEGNDRLEGGDHDDELFGGPGNDVIYGGRDDDTIQPGDGDDLVDGDSGDDWIDYRDDDGGAVIDMTNRVGDYDGTAYGPEIGYDLFDGIDHVYGTEGDDLIIGDDDHNSIEGNDGRDRIIGGRGNDSIDGGTGTNTVIYSGNRSDYTITISSITGYDFRISDNRLGAPDGVDQVNRIDFIEFFDARIRDDDVLSTAPTANADSFEVRSDRPAILDVLSNDVDPENDALTLVGVISLPSSGMAYVVDNQLVFDPNDSFDHLAEGERSSVSVDYQITDENGWFSSATVSIDVVGQALVPIFLTELNDTYFDNDRGNQIHALGSDDLVYGGIGDDSVDGGDGNDTLDGGIGNDTLEGGVGNDELDGGIGTDILFGGTGDDSMSVGGGGPDQIDGGSGNDYLFVDRSDTSEALEITIDPSLDGFNLPDGTSVTGVEEAYVLAGSGNDDVSLAGLGRYFSFGAGNGQDRVTYDLSSHPDPISFQFLDSGPSRSLSASDRFIGGEDRYVSADNFEEFSIVGGLAEDYVFVDMSDDTDGVSFFRDPSVVDFVLPDGTQVASIEDVGILMGSGNDDITVNGLSQFSDFYGGGGHDRASVDLSSHLNEIDFFLTVEDSTRWLAVESQSDVLSTLYVNEFEDISIIGGAADDSLYLDMSSDTAGVNINWDPLRSDFELPDGTHVQNVELIVATTGSGNDDVIVENFGIDTAFWARGGQDSAALNFSNYLNQVNFFLTEGEFGRALSASRSVLGEFQNVWMNEFEEFSIVGGAGIDYLLYDVSSGSEDVSFTWDPLQTVFSLPDGTLVEGVEWLDLRTGSGDDELTFRALGTFSSFDAGSGNDTANVDFSSETDAVNLWRNGIAGQFWAELNSDPSRGFLIEDVEEVIATGGSADDHIEGWSGNDTLNGGAGNDTLDGGFGNDRYFVDSSGDVVVEHVDEGRDTVTTSVTYVLPDNVEIGSMSGSGDIGLTGSAQANTITGNSGDNEILGMGGADRLRGRAGNDTLTGGEGNDILEGGDGENLFVMGPDNGDDQVLDWSAGVNRLDFDSLLGLRFTDLEVTSSGNEALITFDDSSGGTGSVRLIGIDPESLEIGILSDPDGPGDVPLIAGTSAGENLAGTSAAEDLVGLAGNDSLNGRAGDDMMLGGFGNDRYFLDDAGDVAVEHEFQGIDQVDTRFSMVLPDHIERGAVRGGGAVDITGNDLDNFITGSDLENVLTGGDGRDRLIAFAGNDTLDGGLDRDVLEGGDGLDVFVFGPDSNIDLITDFVVGEDLLDVTALGIAFADMTIVDGPLGALVIFDNSPGSVDLVQLQGIAGADVRLASFIGAPNLPIVGTEGNDVLFGTAEDDELQGLGGADRVNGLAGADVMIGGPGDDRYFVDDPGDVVTELPGEGVDQVTTSIDFTLPANVENANTNTTDPVNLTGNALDNLLNGNDAANTLTGLDGDDNLQGNGGTDLIIGGTGADLLRGGTEADTFVFATGDGQGLGDTIIDFEVGVDTIDLSGTGLAYGDLTIQDIGANATIAHGTDLINLLNTTASQLSEDQFDFGEVPLPDLIAFGVTLSASSAAPGDTVFVSYSGQNIGEVSDAGSTAAFYFSDDPLINKDDNRITSQFWSSLDPDEILSSGRPITIPHGVDEGTYYIGVIANDYFGTPLEIVESDYTNNASEGAQIEVLVPDLGGSIESENLLV